MGESLGVKDFHPSQAQPSSWPGHTCPYTLVVWKEVWASARPSLDVDSGVGCGAWGSQSHHAQNRVTSMGLPFPPCSTGIEDVMSYSSLSGIFHGPRGARAQHTQSIIISAQRTSPAAGEAALHSWSTAVVGKSGPALRVCSPTEQRLAPAGPGG